MDKTLKGNNPIQNAMAFSYLLENGRNKLLNDDLYNKAINQLEDNKETSFMTPGFKKEVIEIARYMANMEEKELRKYIFERVKEERKNEKGR